MEVDAPEDQKFEREKLLSLTLPSNYEYLLENVTSPDLTFRATFRIGGIDTPEAASVWVSKYSEKNQVTWRMRASHNPKGRTVLWKKDLRCERNTDNRSRKCSNRKSKNTNCPAKLKITMKKYRNKSKEKHPDPFKKDWPCVVELINQHNHATDFNPRFRTPSEDTKQKLIEMFQQGHSPTSAWRAIKTQLLLKYPEEYEALINDGRYLPTVSVCTHLFHQVMKNKTKIIHCKVADDSLKESLQKGIDEYTNSGKGRALYGSYNGGSYLALCTKLMKRAHTLLRQSSEVVMLDVFTRAEPVKRKRQKNNKEVSSEQHELTSQEECQKQDVKDRPMLFVYFLLTFTPAGHIPLGIIICDNGKDELLQKGLEALHECFPSTAFYSKPQPCFFTLNSFYKEGSPLQLMYPQSRIVLSHSYLLQNAWAWLCDSKKNKILEADRHELYYQIRNLLNAKNDQELAQAHWNLKCHPCASKYAKFQSYLDSLFNMRGLWASFYCGVANNSTSINNYVQIVFRVFKDCILQKVRASSINQLFDVLSTELESYMENTIVDFCYNQFPKTLVKFLPSPASVDCSQIVPHAEKRDCYVVSNDKDPSQIYYVYLNHASCSCLASSTGRLCKHVSAVLQKFSEACAYTSCEQVKKIMYEVATDKQAPSSWEPPVIPNIIYEVGDVDAMLDSVVHDKALVPRKTNALLPEIENAKKILKSIYSRLENSTAVNPILFIPAIKQMEKNLEGLKTEESLARAIQNFGTVPSTIHNGCCNQAQSGIDPVTDDDEWNDRTPDDASERRGKLTLVISKRNVARYRTRNKSSRSYSETSESEEVVYARKQPARRCSVRTPVRTVPYFVPIAPKPSGTKPAPDKTILSPTACPKLVKGNVENAPVFFVVEKQT